MKAVRTVGEWVLICNPKKGPLPMVAKRLGSSWTPHFGRTLDEPPMFWMKIPELPPVCEPAA